MGPHPDTICLFATMDHDGRQAQARRDRLVARAQSGREPGDGRASGVAGLVRASLARAGGHMKAVWGGRVAPVPPAASIAPRADQRRLEA